MKLLLKISILSILFLLFIPANAQIPSSIDGVTIDTSESNPRPGDNVTVSIESYSFDLNVAAIVWIVDGKVKEQGVGIKKITIVAPKTGLKTSVSVKIKGSSGKEVQKNIVIQSNYVDIIWESNGYKPPFFGGKLPFTYQNTIKFIAVPHIAGPNSKEIDPKTLVYVWRNGGKYVENGQGYGKQSIEIPADNIPKTLDIRVDITNREQTLNVSGTMNLTPSEPSLLFYEEDSLYGIQLNRALDNTITMKNKEMKILAVPFGFNIDGGKNSYIWSVNSIEQPDLVSNRSITIRTKGDNAGSSNVDLDLRNLNKILQGVRGAITVNFNK